MSDDQTLLDALHLLVRRLLKPAARTLLRFNIHYRELIEIAKESYVEAAAEADGGSIESLNVSRVAVKTGMTRRDVRQIADTFRIQAGKRKSRLNALTRVLSAWHIDTDFSHRGAPKELPISGKDGSFEALVSKYASDIPAGAIASGLKESGALAVTDNGHYAAASRYVMPPLSNKLNVDAVVRAGSVVEDLTTTIEHNLLATVRSKTRFEGRATNMNIPLDKREKFRDFIEHQGQEFLERIDEWLTANEADTTDSLNSRLGLGIYTIDDQEKSSGKS